MANRDHLYSNPGSITESPMETGRVAKEINREGVVELPLNLSKNGNLSGQSYSIVNITEFKLKIQRKAISVPSTATQNRQSVIVTQLSMRTDHLAELSGMQNLAVNDTETDSEDYLVEEAFIEVETERPQSSFTDGPLVINEDSDSDDGFVNPYFDENKGDSSKVIELTKEQARELDDVIAVEEREKEIRTARIQQAKITGIAKGASGKNTLPIPKSSREPIAGTSYATPVVLRRVKLHQSIPCVICPVVLKDYSEVMLHYMQHCEEYVICNECNTGFPNLQSYRDHNLLHLAEGRWANVPGYLNAKDWASRFAVYLVDRGRTLKDYRVNKYMFCPVCTVTSAHFKFTKEEMETQVRFTQRELKDIECIEEHISKHLLYQKLACISCSEEFAYTSFRTEKAAKEHLFHSHYLKTARAMSRKHLNKYFIERIPIKGLESVISKALDRSVEILSRIRTRQHNVWSTPQYQRKILPKSKG